MKVSEIMTKDLVTVDPSSMAMDAAEKMQAENVGAVLVADGDHLRGIVTDRQITTKVVASGLDPAEIPVTDIMTKNPVTASPDMELEDATRIMGDNRFRRVPVVKDERLVGIISTADIAAHARECNVCINNILNEVAKAVK